MKCVCMYVCVYVCVCVRGACSRPPTVIIIIGIKYSFMCNEVVFFLVGFHIYIFPLKEFLVLFDCLLSVLILLFQVMSVPTCYSFRNISTVLSEEGILTSDLN